MAARADVDELAFACATFVPNATGAPNNHDVVAVIVTIPAPGVDVYSPIRAAVEVPIEV